MSKVWTSDSSELISPEFSELRLAIIDANSQDAPEVVHTLLSVAGLWVPTDLLHSHYFIVDVPSRSPLHSHMTTRTRESRVWGRGG